MGHTPGPWYRDGYKNDVIRSAIVRDATGFEVALTRHWGVHETEANANLIASAPELLAILKRIVAVDDRGGTPSPSLMEEALAVVKKAEP